MRHANHISCYLRGGCTRGADWVDVVEAGWTEPHDRGEERTRRTKTTTWQR